MNFKNYDVIYDPTCPGLVGIYVECISQPAIVVWLTSSINGTGYQKIEDYNGAKWEVIGNLRNSFRGLEEEIECEL